MRNQMLSGACAAACGVVLAMMAGCVPIGTLPQSPGLYNVTRGTTSILIGWVIGSSTGQAVVGGGQGELLPIDANNPNIPQALKPLVEQWNQGLDQLNADIDTVFPNQVIISHPQPWVVKVANPDDPNRFFQGANGKDGFLAVVGGGIQPGALGISSVKGKWDGQDTITGEWTTSITVGGSGQQGGGGLLTLGIKVPYEAVLVP
jgi:hypothetical protein